MLGTGYIPIAPATFASLVALPAIRFLPRNVPVYFALALATYLLGVYLADTMERRWGRDTRHITIDEFVGMLVTMFLVPFSIWSAILGFLLFRFFDIVKPRFVRAAERLSRGWGVMTDDVLAGACANAVLQVVFRVIWHAPALDWRIV